MRGNSRNIIGTSRFDHEVNAEALFQVPGNGEATKQQRTRQWLKPKQVWI